MKESILHISQKLKSIKAVFILFVFYPASFFAQNISPQIIPPSPPAYALGKYGDIPVGFYTGVPDITIPICTMSNHNLSVDISLSYHASGIKIDEIASFVGLGWSLNAGGVITRTVHGRGEYLQSNGTIRPSRAAINFYNPAINHDEEQFIVDNNLYASANNILDNEPDVFYYNFNGKYGKFYFDNTGSAVLGKDEDISIKWQYVSDGIQKFVIKDEAGNTYEFNDYETTYYGNDDGLLISAWYLSKIIAPDGNQINFEYYAAGASPQYVRSYSSTVVDLSTPNPSISNPINVPYSSINLSELKIHKIITPNGRVEFNFKNENRLDYASSTVVSLGKAALKEILIYSSDNTLKKKFKITTGYFQANNAKKYNGLNPSDFAFLNYRLRLDAVQEFSGDESIVAPSYTFKYLGDDNPNTDDLYTLPYRLSPNQDHWGYYNWTSNSHLLPGNPTHVSISQDKWLPVLSNEENGGGNFVNASFGNGANREPNGEAMKAGMLIEVHYPTGGYTKFDYEPNYLSGQNGGLRIHRIISYPIAGSPKETVYTYEDGYNNYDPKNYYYQVYKVSYGYDIHGVMRPKVSSELLQKLGLPASGLGYVPTNGYINFVTITAQPQAILGAGSQIGYSGVKVSQTGNGATYYGYDANSIYPDYTEWDGIEEFNILQNMFSSQYISAYSHVELFSQTYSTSLSVKDWPFPEIFNNDWKRGILNYVGITSEDGKQIRSESYYYTTKLVSAIPGYKVELLRDNEFIYTKYYIAHSSSKLDYKVITDWDQNGVNSTTTKINYYYDNISHQQPTRIETWLSDNRKKTVQITYPLDYANGIPFIDNMKVNHLINYPIEQVTYCENGSNNIVLSGIVAKYKSDGSGVKEEEWKIGTGQPIATSAFKFSNRLTGVLPPTGSLGSFSQDSHYKPNLYFDLYDSYGNLLQQHKSNDINHSYIWGYNSQYPIAEAINAKSNEIYSTSFEEGGWDANMSYDATHVHSGKNAGYINKATSGELYSFATQHCVVNLTAAKKFHYSGWIYSGGPTTQVFLYIKSTSGTITTDNIASSATGKWTLLEKDYTVPAGTAEIWLRVDNNGSGQAWYDDLRLYPSDAQMTTYTYQPLVGMTSQTDAGNRTTYYEYDGMGRLSLTRDDAGEIIKKYDYKYGVNVP